MIRRVLLVDDDNALLQILSAALEEEGFEVDTARDGVKALVRFAATPPPDLVILDVLLPEMDGLSVCRKIREKSNIPVFLLTSRGEEVDRVTGLELGADDYVTKPFSTRELCARIRALDRRLERPAGAGVIAPGMGQGAPLKAGDLTLDPARFEVHWRGTALSLTRSEFELLGALVKQRGMVLSRDRLLDLARGDGVVVTDRTVDTFVKRIRQKIRAVDPNFDDIETVFGVGYRYRA